MAVKVQVAVFWVVMPCLVHDHESELCNR